MPRKRGRLGGAGRGGRHGPADDRAGDDGDRAQGVVPDGQAGGLPVEHALALDGDRVLGAALGQRGDLLDHPVDAGVDVLELAQHRLLLLGHGGQRALAAVGEVRLGVRGRARRRAVGVGGGHRQQQHRGVGRHGHLDRLDGVDAQRAGGPRGDHRRLGDLGLGVEVERLALAAGHLVGRFADAERLDEHVRGGGVGGGDEPQQRQRGRAADDDAAHEGEPPPAQQREVGVQVGAGAHGGMVS
ncbi:hypothetical protein [Nonomuraea salmonea]|uniref:hypothetical protein n=1 Tax=Nonomuraea salmonea TaxID=46181 RepID=UPI0031EA3C09